MLAAPIAPRQASTSLVAGPALLAFHGVLTDEFGLAQYASAGVRAHAGRLVGFTAHAAIPGGPVRVLHAGTLQNDGWNWPPGALLFLGLDGQITSAQVGVFSQRIGHARSATEVWIDIQNVIVRA
jgi:hypothetical protein